MRFLRRLLTGERRLIFWEKQPDKMRERTPDGEPMAPKSPEDVEHAAASARESTAKLITHFDELIADLKKKNRPTAEIDQALRLKDQFVKEAKALAATLREIEGQENNLRTGLKRIIERAQGKTKEMRDAIEHRSSYYPSKVTYRPRDLSLYQQHQKGMISDRMWKLYNEIRGKDGEKTWVPGTTLSTGHQSLEYIIPEEDNDIVGRIQIVNPDTGEVSYNYWSLQRAIPAKMILPTLGSNKDLLSKKLLATEEKVSPEKQQEIVAQFKSLEESLKTQNAARPELGFHTDHAFLTVGRDDYKTHNSWGHIKIRAFVKSGTLEFSATSMIFHTNDQKCHMFDFAKVTADKIPPGQASIIIQRMIDVQMYEKYTDRTSVVSAIQGEARDAAKDAKELEKKSTAKMSPEVTDQWGSLPDGIGMEGWEYYLDTESDTFYACQYTAKGNGETDYVYMQLGSDHAWKKLESPPAQIDRNQPLETELYPDTEVSETPESPQQFLKTLTELQIPLHGDALDLLSNLEIPEELEERLTRYADHLEVICQKQEGDVLFSIVHQKTAMPLTGVSTSQEKFREGSWMRSQYLYFPSETADFEHERFLEGRPSFEDKDYDFYRNHVPVYTQIFLKKLEGLRGKQTAVDTIISDAESSVHNAFLGVQSRSDLIQEALESIAKERRDQSATRVQVEIPEDEDVMFERSHLRMYTGIASKAPPYFVDPSLLSYEKTAEIFKQLDTRSAHLDQKEQALRDLWDKIEDPRDRPAQLEHPAFTTKIPSPEESLETHRTHFSSEVPQAIEALLALGSSRGFDLKGADTPTELPTIKNALISLNAHLTTKLIGESDRNELIGLCKALLVKSNSSNRLFMVRHERIEEVGIHVGKEQPFELTFDENLMQFVLTPLDKYENEKIARRSREQLRSKGPEIIARLATVEASAMDSWPNSPYVQGILEELNSLIEPRSWNADNTYLRQMASSILMQNKGQPLVLKNTSGTRYLLTLQEGQYILRKLPRLQEGLQSIGTKILPYFESWTRKRTGAFNDKASNSSSREDLLNTTPQMSATLKDAVDQRSYDSETDTWVTLRKRPKRERDDESRRSAMEDLTGTMNKRKNQFYLSVQHEGKRSEWVILTAPGIKPEEDAAKQQVVLVNAADPGAQIVCTLGDVISEKKIHHDHVSELIESALEESAEEKLQSQILHRESITKDRPVAFLGCIDGSDKIIASGERNMKYMPVLFQQQGYDMVTTGDYMLDLTHGPRDPAQIIGQELDHLYSKGIRDFYIAVGAHGSEDLLHFGSKTLHASQLMQLTERFPDAKFYIDTVACFGGGLEKNLKDYRDPYALPEEPRVFVFTQTQGNISNITMGANASASFTGSEAFFLEYIDRGTDILTAHAKKDISAKRFLPGQDAEYIRTHSLSLEKQQAIMDEKGGHLAGRISELCKTITGKRELSLESMRKKMEEIAQYDLREAESVLEITDSATLAVRGLEVLLDKHPRTAPSAFMEYIDADNLPEWKKMIATVKDVVADRISALHEQELSTTRPNTYGESLTNALEKVSDREPILTDMRSLAALCIKNQPFLTGVDTLPGELPEIRAQLQSLNKQFSSGTEGITQPQRNSLARYLMGQANLYQFRVDGNDFTKAYHLAYKDQKFEFQEIVRSSTTEVANEIEELGPVLLKKLDTVLDQSEDPMNDPSVRDLLLRLNDIIPSGFPPPSVSNINADRSYRMADYKQKLKVTESLRTLLGKHRAISDRLWKEHRIRITARNAEVKLIKLPTAPEGLELIGEKPMSNYERWLDRMEFSYAYLSRTQEATYLHLEKYRERFSAHKGSESSHGGVSLKFDQYKDSELDRVRAAHPFAHRIDADGNKSRYEGSEPLFYLERTEGGKSERWIVVRGWIDTQGDLEEDSHVLLMPEDNAQVQINVPVNQLLPEGGSLNAKLAVEKMDEARANYKTEIEDTADLRNTDLPKGVPIGFIGAIEEKQWGDSLSMFGRHEAEHLPTLLTEQGYTMVSSGRWIHDFQERSLYYHGMDSMERRKMNYVQMEIDHLKEKGVKDFFLSLVSHGEEDYFKFGNYEFKATDLIDVFNNNPDCSFTVTTIACFGGGVAKVLKNYQDPHAKQFAAKNGGRKRIQVYLQTKGEMVNITRDLGSYNVTPNGTFFAPLLRQQLGIGASAYYADLAAKSANHGIDGEAITIGEDGTQITR